MMTGLCAFVAASENSVDLLFRSEGLIMFMRGALTFRFHMIGVASLTNMGYFATFVVVSVNQFPGASKNLIIYQFWATLFMLIVSSFSMQAGMRSLRPATSAVNTLKKGCRLCCSRGFMSQPILPGHSGSSRAGKRPESRLVARGQPLQPPTLSRMRHAPRAWMGHRLVGDALVVHGSALSEDSGPLDVHVECKGPLRALRPLPTLAPLPHFSV